MKLFAIADLHLNGNSNKPMDVFGEKWENHAEHLSDAWQNIVSREDLVLIPGDISWAMRFDDVLDDLQFISKLNGRKILIRGNHDYWWASPSRIRSVLPPDIKIIQNDSVKMNSFAVAGSRGWQLPGTPNFDASVDTKIYARELIRLELSLKSAGEMPVVLMTHFPPIGENGEATGVTDLIDRYNVTDVLYGHLHAGSCRQAFEGEFNGKNYYLCSADYLNFKPRLIREF